MRSIASRSTRCRPAPKSPGYAETWRDSIARAPDARSRTERGNEPSRPDEARDPPGWNTGWRAAGRQPGSQRAPSRADGIAPHPASARSTIGNARHPGSRRSTIGLSPATVAKSLSIGSGPTRGAAAACVRLDRQQRLPQSHGACAKAPRRDRAGRVSARAADEPAHALAVPRRARRPRAAARRRRPRYRRRNRGHRRRGARPDAARGGRQTHQARSRSSTTPACARSLPRRWRKARPAISARRSASMSPVAVTPDELGDAWNGGTIDLPARLSRQRRACWDGPTPPSTCRSIFATSSAHATVSRPLGSAPVIATGTVSNRDRSGRLGLHRRASDDRDAGTWRAATAYLGGRHASGSRCSMSRRKHLRRDRAAGRRNARASTAAPPFARRNRAHHRRTRGQTTRNQSASDCPPCSPVEIREPEIEVAQRAGGGDGSDVDSIAERFATSRPCDRARSTILASWALTPRFPELLLRPHRSLPVARAPLRREDRRRQTAR